MSGVTEKNLLSIFFIVGGVVLLLTNDGLGWFALGVFNIAVHSFLIGTRYDRPA